MTSYIAKKTHQHVVRPKLAGSLLSLFEVKIKSWRSGMR